MLVMFGTIIKMLVPDWLVLSRAGNFQVAFSVLAWYARIVSYALIAFMNHSTVLVIANVEGSSSSSIQSENSSIE